MILKLDMNSTVPIYVQLRNQIVMGIGHGELKEGERLPTVRQLASDAGVNSIRRTRFLKRKGIYRPTGGKGRWLHATLP